MYTVNEARVNKKRIAVFFKKVWWQLLEDGEITALQHVGAIQEKLSMNNIKVHLSVLHELVTSS
jgi:hypothetical protein